MSHFKPLTSVLYTQDVNLWALLLCTGAMSLGVELRTLQFSPACGTTCVGAHFPNHPVGLQGPLLGSFQVGILNIQKLRDLCLCFMKGINPIAYNVVLLMNG